jgi:hypothetical protein
MLKKQLTMLLERFPDEKRNIRRSVVWMAFRRKFLRFARMTRAFTNQLVDGLHTKSTNKEQLRQLFRKADLDQSGTLTTDEVKEVLRKFGFTCNPDVMEVRVVYRNQRDSFAISLSFIRIVLRTWYHLPPCSPLTLFHTVVSYRVVVQEVLRRFDTDGDGTVSIDEFLDFFKSNGGTKSYRVVTGKGAKLVGDLKEGNIVGEGDQVFDAVGHRIGSTGGGAMLGGRLAEEKADDGFVDGSHGHDAPPGRRPSALNGGGGNCSCMETLLPAMIAQMRTAMRQEVTAIVHKELRAVQYATSSEGLLTPIDRTPFVDHHIEVEDFQGSIGFAHHHTDQSNNI